MKKGLNWLLKLVIITVVSAVVILLVFIFWLYFGQLTPKKTLIFQKLPLPYALINGSTVPMRDYIFRYNLTKQILKNTGTVQTDSEIKQTVKSELIYNEEINQLAQRYGIVTGQTQIDNEYNYRLSQDPSYNENITSAYNLSSDQIKNTIIKPELVKINLETWFNSQTSLNKDAYAEANDLMLKIKQGQAFSDLASSQSDDLSDKIFSGDLGFVSVTSLLPELRDSIENMKPGDTKIIPSRFGLHIIQLEDFGNDNLLHLKQIFINSNNFNNWLNNQMRQFWVITF